MSRQTTQRLHAPTHRRSKLPLSAVIGGLFFLLIAVAGSAMMSAKHIWALSLPGCGPGAGCDWAMSSAWSKVLGVPVAFLGLAFFVSSLVLRLATFRKGLSGLLLYTVRLGCVVSVGFIILMLSAGHLCVWCLSIHLSNVLWWSSVELAAAREHTRFSLTAREIIFGGLAFLAVVSTTEILESRYRIVAESEAHRAALKSISRIGLPQDPTDKQISIGKDSSPSSKGSPAGGSRKFGGRFWIGNPNATVRIVVFQDYQCELCKEVEGILSNLLKTRSELALSVKQWPFDESCNNQILGENIHPGSCLAARYAEAAGLCGGDKTFWAMHYWLVAQGGKVDTSSLKAELSGLGVNWVQFREAMQNPAMDSIIASDISQGVQLGLKYTPMVFVNGYQVEGWQSAGALPAAIERAAEFARQQPKPSDQPDPAIDKQFSQWLAQPATMVAIRNDDHIYGRIGAPTAILIYGDVSDPYNAVAYRMLDPWLKDASKVCVIFRTFPLQPECNDMVKRRINDRACEAAQTAEGAAVAAGEPAFWTALKWLSESNGKYPNSLATAVAPRIGVSRAALTLAASDSVVASRIRENVESAKQLGIDTSPTIFVNGRRLRDWRTPGLLDRAIKHAAGPAMTSKAGSDPK